MKKRVLSLFLAITLCLTLTPTGVLAEESLPEQMVTATQEAQIPAPALEEKEEEKTTPAQTGAGENAPPANPEENPTEDAPAAAEKNTADEETGKEADKEAGQNEPTAEGKNEPLALGLDDPGQNAAEGENGEAGMSNVLEFTVAEKADPVASVTMSDGTETPYGSFSDAWAAAIANNGSTLKLLADGTLSDDNTDIGQTLTLDLNGYMLGSNSSLTVKNGAALTVKNASAENSGNPVQVGLYLTLLVEKGGSFTCTDGKIQYLGLQAAGTGDYAIRLAEGENHCAFGGFAQGDANATIGDLLKAAPGMALYAEDTGSTVQIARSTLISNGFNYFSFYVGACSEHQIGEDGTCDYCGASYVASVTTGGKTVSYTSLDDALNAAQNGDTVTLLSDVDLGETYVTIDKSITFDLGDKTLSSSKAWLSYGVLLIKNATVTVKNGTVKATGSASCAIRAYGSGASMTLEDVTATVTSDESSVMVGDFGSTVIKSGDYQGLYVGAKSQVTLEGGTFRPYMDTITTNENVKSIFWQVNETTDTTSRDCMELLGDGCVYVDETETQVRTGGGFNTVVTVQQGTAIDAPVAKIGDVEYASLSKAINAVQNGGTITLLNDLDLGNGAVLQVGSPRKNFTIDLASHTLSADGDCLIMLHNGSQLTLKNGTLDGSRCTSYEGVLYISSNSGPKLTLENVTAKNVQRSVPLVYVTNGTVEFDGGTYTGGVLVHSNGNAVLKNGTFQKGNNSYSIKTDVSGKQLSNYLDGESLFWKDNAPLDLSSATETADEVTVRPCKHNWENGKCTVCQKVCDHGSADGKSMTEDPCPTCGMKAAAQVDITGSDAKYFPSFNDALVYATNNNGCTLKLLANVTDPVSINTPFIFDLNGHNFNKLSVGARAKIRDSGTTKGILKELKVFNIVDADGDETVLTVADLLEEGYAFKSSSENKWYFGVENAITNVTVQPAPIKSVTAEHPTVTVEYGKTSGVTLTATAVPATEGGTVSYQWYEIGGTDFPIQDATENTYQLPADLGAGMHTYRLTATSDGYPKSVDITVKVTPISLAGAKVTVQNPTYNGKEQRPTVTVTLDGKTLTSKDFSVYALKQTDAGSYKLTVSGENNYTGKIENVEWKIEPMKIKGVKDVTSVSKNYDGSADVTLPKDNVTFLDAAGTVISLPENAFTITKARFTTRQDGFVYEESPNAGTKKAISFTLTLTDTNYAFEDEAASVRSADFNFSPNDDRFTIKQATVTLPDEITQLVFNDLAKTYTIDLAKLLPKLSEGCAYGSIQYQGHNYNFTDNAYLDGNDAVSVSKEGVLSLSTVAASTANVGDQIGTITVPVVTTNYQKFKFTIKVVISERIPLNASDVTVSASEITYGQTLNESKLTATGTMKHPGTGEEVKGTFAWTNPEAKPGAAGDYTASWTFTPAEGYEEYATATGTVKVKVKPAKLTVSVKASSMYYTGEEQIASIIASGESVDSTPVTFTYSDKEDGNYTSGVPTFTDAGTYTVYYKAEAANHEPATGTFPVTIKPMELLRFVSTPSVTKTYDGTAVAPLSEDAVTFNSRNASNLSLPTGAYSITNARFTMKQTDGSYADSPEVGNGKSLSFTVTLTSDNYVFESTTEDSKTIVCDIATDDANRFTITKAAAPTNIPSGTLNIINGTKQTYTYDFSKLLPELSEGEYGTISYGNQAAISLVPQRGYYYDETIVEFKKGKLTLAQFYAKDGEMTGQIGTVKVKVTTTNYEDFQLTLVLNAINKPTPNDKITASDITYGQALSASTITGTMKDPTTGKEITGTFTWTDGTVKPNAGNHNAEWIFTPDESYGGKYTTYTDTAPVTVNPKEVKVSGITAKDKVYDGNTDAVLDFSNAKFDGILENDKLTVTAKGVFEKTEAGKRNVAISDLTLGGNSVANYVLAESGNQTETTATITAREATVTPDNKSKVYEEKDPDLTYAVSGVLDGETLKGITLTRAEGENAGKYAITATADAGANPNYDVTFAEGTLTIEPKSIKGAKVVLGKGLTANGAEQTQTVEKVLLDGKEIPADSYTVAGNTATDPGRYTLTITAKGNYTDSVKQTYAIAPAKAADAPGAEIVIGSGKVKVVVKSEGAVPPATLLTDKAELLAMLVESGDITADELAQIADGASVDIVLTVKEANVSAEIKTAMAQAAKGCTIGQYLDISLFKYMTVNGKQQDGVALRTTKNALTVSVVVPDALINMNSAVNRTYCIVRNHDGAITVLDAAFDAASKTLTFKTDRFSDYAIAYKDTAVPSGSNPSSNNSSNDSETKKNEVAAPTPASASTSKPSTITAMPQTGDTSNPTLYVVLLVASLLGLAVVFVCKKRNDK